MLGSLVHLGKEPDGKKLSLLIWYIDSYIIKKRTNINHNYKLVLQYVLKFDLRFYI
jgi:hypothetical protein